MSKVVKEMEKDGENNRRGGGSEWECKEEEGVPDRQVTLKKFL